MQERDAYIALNMMEKVGPVGVRALVSTLGSASAVFDASARDLQAADGIGAGAARAIESQREQIDVEAEVAAAAALGARLITPLDEEYPKALREIHDPPLALYVKGRLQSRDSHAIAVVGTRRPTLYGRDVAARLSTALAKSGMTVVSGLAEGIDTCAHDGALAGPGRTLAVIGSGLDCLYPACNRELGDRVAEHGALMSEFPLGRKPDKTTFPMRNRIVSGLSMGVVVVEAGAKSGALITVRMALEQGRTVFAVPGRIDRPMSRGPNNLLKQGACPVTRLEDILEAFEFLVPPERHASAAQAAPMPDLTDAEKELVDLLRNGAIGVDSLIRQSGQTAAQVGASLVALEMKKVVRMLAGRRVEAVRQ